MSTRHAAKLHKGDRVTLIDVPPGYEPYELKVGDRGTVEIIDSQGTTHIRWLNGKHVGILAANSNLLRVAVE